MSRIVCPELDPQSAAFDEVVRQYLRDTRRLGRWLKRNEHDAEYGVSRLTQLRIDEQGSLARTISTLIVSVVNGITIVTEE